MTGGCGFIGSNLIRLLLKNTDHAVLNVDALTYAGNITSLQDLPSTAAYQFKNVDICDAKAISAVVADFKPDWIMHLAAESHVDRSIDAPSVFINTNVMGTFNLLHTATHYYSRLDDDSKGRFRFLHVSTDEVYGSLGDSGFFTEETAYDPRSPYSASKAASDHLARAWHATYGLPVVVTNCSNNYGPYQFPEKLIPVVILKACRGQEIPVYGQGENVRDWLYVVDHAEALIRAISRGRIGETYNIGGNNEQRNIDLVRTLCLILDRIKPRADGRSYEEQIVFVKDRPGHDHRYAIDASKIRNELGWVAKQDQTSGFEKTVVWYLENEAWWAQILDGTYNLERLGSST